MDDDYRCLLEVVFSARESKAACLPRLVLAEERVAKERVAATAFQTAPCFPNKRLRESVVWQLCTFFWMTGFVDVFLMIFFYVFLMILTSFGIDF